MDDQATQEATMRKLTLEQRYEIAMAVGKDTANRCMRKAGRTQWNDQDWNVMVKEFNQLFPLAGDTDPEKKRRTA